jgi:hypothetical protein
MSKTKTRTLGHPHGVLWEGRSLLDDGPIVAIVTSGSANQKTGPMAQVWIVRQDVAPYEARKKGLDFSVCGHCPMHSACYVLTFHGPRSVWAAYRAGLYQPVSPADFERSAIRWGAYGDPALLPPALVKACNERARFWTGYTHQHHQAWAAWSKGIFMASVESTKQEARARAQGWGTFRVGLADGSDAGAATVCPYESTGTTCLECKACDGSPRTIYVAAHGGQAHTVPAERLKKRRE